jgi:hypothetical protein
MAKAKQQETLDVRSTIPFKLKDKEGRNLYMIDLYETFKFFPKKILIKKVPGQNNVVVISAVLEPGIVEEKTAEKGGASNG